MIYIRNREFFTYNLLETIKENTTKRQWIYGCHPTFNSTKNFFEEPILAYKNALEANKSV